MRIQNQYIQVSPSAVQSFSPSILTLLPFSQIPAFLSPVSVIITPFPFYFPKAHSPSYLLPLFHENTPCPCFLSSKQYPLQLFPSKNIKINHKSQPDLHLNDQFVLQQVVTTANMNYYLTGTEVWYTGNGLNKKATIVSVNNSVKGQVIIQLNAEIAWRSVTIKVTSTLSNTQTGARRLLVQTTYDPVVVKLRKQNASRLKDQKHVLSVSNNAMLKILLVIIATHVHLQQSSHLILLLYYQNQQFDQLIYVQSFAFNLNQQIYLHNQQISILIQFYIFNNQPIIGLSRKILSQNTHLRILKQYVLQQQFLV
ncbi:unnamed protein product [Paramecium octaurelia]|uniref:Uncharacterized protein n=1 Tax=Paramecium octaurelia TaxID=43137 RepID=A0A8S1YBI7_PAROT|nr:unnamed protein product [Paramecium octaurelia]